MRRISKISMAAGVTILVVAGTLLDSPQPYWKIIAATAVFGLVMVIIGCVMYGISARKQKDKLNEFCLVKRRDRLDMDIEWIVTKK